MDPAIEIRNLSRRFGAHQAVDDLSLRVPRHSIYGFLGRNGAGKTTTLKMLLGLLRPDTGSIRIAGIDVIRDRMRAARKMGALLEAHGFYSALSGRGNLDLSRRLLGCPASEVDRVLDVVDMRALGSRRVAAYSLGMRQRLGIARALLGAPSVLILDEPGNGLDPEGMADMRDFLRDLPGRSGATVMVSSHLLGEIEQTATHVGVLRHGRLVLEGELDALKASLAARVEIEVDDLVRAKAVLDSYGFAVESARGHLSVQFKTSDEPRATTAALTHALCDAGIAVHAVKPCTRSLETLYRRASDSTVAEAA